MFERLQLLYAKGRIDTNGLQRAVALGWITEEEFNKIVNI